MRQIVVLADDKGVERVPGVEFQTAHRFMERYRCGTGTGIPAAVSFGCRKGNRDVPLENRGYGSLENRTESFLDVIRGELAVGFDEEDVLAHRDASGRCNPGIKRSGVDAASTLVLHEGPEFLRG